MHKSQKASGGNAVFYKSPGIVKEVRAGYLYKSPPSRLLKTEKSWKMRFFVLFEINNQEHQLKYFKSAEDRDKPLGMIDLSQISLMYPSPQNHQKWGWVEKNLKCSPSCVLYVKVVDRDYFLVGQNSWEVDDWFADLADALHGRQQKVPRPVGNECGLNSSLLNCDVKQRSISDPPPNVRPKIRQAAPRRPSSEPLNPLYDYPRSYLKGLQVNNDASPKKREAEDETVGTDNDRTVYMSMEAVYETMTEAKQNKEELAQALDSEVEEFTGGSLMRSVTQVFDKLKIQISPLPKCDVETTTEDSKGLVDGDRKEHLTDSGGTSSENEAASPIEMLSRDTPSSSDKHTSTERVEVMIPGEKDIEFNRADLKKHLTLAEVDGKPCVSGWTGHQQALCLFHKGDQILAINDLHTSSVEEFDTYLSKLLKSQVKLTILRLPGCLPLHSARCLCSDGPGI
ncbi:pleckstrin homology domain-containing family S member 1-like isoform 1-T1 [Polymixia lowei]